MSDVLNKEKRSEIMRKVRSENNKSTELRFISIFHELGLKGWRRKYPIKDSPDFIFIKQRAAIFADDCFWYGYDCRNTSPSDNKEYWVKKISSNMERDRITNFKLQRQNCLVIRIWECELTKKIGN